MSGESPAEGAEPVDCGKPAEESWEPAEEAAEPAEESAEEGAGCAEPAGPAPPEKTSDFYRVEEDLPERFKYPACFRGYRTKGPVTVYRTSNQAYGSRAPTVHEMPKVFYAYCNSFSRQLAAAGMFRNTSFNVQVEKSAVSGADNCITSYNRLNFHPSYNMHRPSICHD